MMQILIVLSLNELQVQTTQNFIPNKGEYKIHIKLHIKVINALL